MKTLSAITLALSSCLGACHHPVHHQRVVQVLEGAPVPNMHRGDRLDIVLLSGDLDEMRTNCDHMGGDDLTSVDGSIFICENVDF